MLKKMTLEKQNPSLPRGNSSHCCWAWPFQLRFDSTSPKKNEAPRSGDQLFFLTQPFLPFY